MALAPVDVCGSQSGLLPRGFQLLGKIRDGLTGPCPSTPQVTRLAPPAAPAWGMQACEPWPTSGDDGRVRLDAASEAVREAQVAHADCRAWLTGAQQYIKAITE